jgi:hypothetical protein
MENGPPGNTKTDECRRILLPIFRFLFCTRKLIKIFLYKNSIFGFGEKYLNNSNFCSQNYYKMAAGEEI